MLDLGTNVFNMLLAHSAAGGYEYIREYKCAAKLGAGGLASGELPQEAFETATAALEKILTEIEMAGGADKIYPFATSAVRDALNGTEFVNYVKERFGLEVQVIPGEREAELIFKGIMKSLPDGLKERGENILMLDIGGGSNEFIISDGKKILWKRSFPIGMARMRGKFQYRDPLPSDVASDFVDYCTAVLEPLWREVESYDPRIFVGSSGSFDTFRDLLYGVEMADSPGMVFSRERLEKLHGELMASTAEERLRMPGMSQIRVDYIVLASLFTKMVLDRVRPHTIYQSSYSLKEGAMDELLGETEPKTERNL